VEEEGEVEGEGDAVVVVAGDAVDAVVGDERKRERERDRARESNKERNPMERWREEEEGFRNFKP